MSSISWEWVDFWAWVEQIEDVKQKAHALQQVNEGGWIGRLSAENQANVFRHAPMEVKRH